MASDSYFTDHTSEEDTSTSTTLKNSWSIRPCEIYKDEYDDCRSIKGRFHQYFIHGKNIDCSQWQRDFENCQRYEESNGNDIKAGEAVIESETQRRIQRLEAHYANTTWKRRSSPPKDWSKPLPDWLVKRNENTYLAIKQKESEGESPIEKEGNAYCSIM